MSEKATTREAIASKNPIFVFFNDPHKHVQNNNTDYVGLVEQLVKFMD